MQSFIDTKDFLTSKKGAATLGAGAVVLSIPVFGEFAAATAGVAFTGYLLYKAGQAGYEAYKGNYYKAGYNAGTAVGLKSQAFAVSSTLKLSGYVINNISPKTNLSKVTEGGWMNRSTVLGADEATALNASRMVPETGVHQVLLHGTGDGFIVNGAFTSPKDLARTMLQSGYQRGTPVRLISCHTGVFGDGAAYQLSRYLRSPVIAPTNKIRIIDGGGYEIFGGGRFRTFFNTTIK